MAVKGFDFRLVYIACFPSRAVVKMQKEREREASMIKKDFRSLRSRKCINSRKKKNTLTIVADSQGNFRCKFVIALLFWRNGMRWCTKEHTHKRKRRILDEFSPEEVLFSNIQNTREDIVTSVLVASHEVLVREMMVLEFARFCRTHAEHNPFRGVWDSTQTTPDRT